MYTQAMDTAPHVDPAAVEDAELQRRFDARIDAGDFIENLAWMTDETKKKALAKLATFTPKVGYPNK